MDDGTSGPRRCEVCGDPIRPSNKTGICSGRGKPECARARDRERQSRRPPRSPAIRQAPRPVTEVRHCEVCGDALRCDNQIGICCSRKRPDCIKARKQRIRKMTPVPPVVIVKAGDTFGRWTALEDYTPANRHVLARCQCGTVKRIRGSYLARGGTQSCGCSRSGPRKSHPPYLTAGAVFGRLTVLEDVAYMLDPAPCRCECGKGAVPRAGNIKNGITRSCGCLSRERQATQGGLSRHPLYGIWNSMIDRCTNPKVKGYHNYGGRGIKVCDRWLDLRVFIEDVEREIGPRPEGVRESGRVLYSFDRKDNDGNYEPGNVCWSTSAEQVRNQRKVVRLTRERDALAAELAALKASLGLS